MYAVLGATGNTGSVVVRELLQRGAKVRAIVRDASKAAQLRERGAEVALSELDDGPGLSVALQGVSAAYVMLPPRVDSEDLLAAAQKTSDVIARAVAAAQVPHVVLLSSVGAELPEGSGPILGNRYAEQVLRQVTPLLSALRPPYFMENWREGLGALDAGKLISMLALDHAIPMIATEDIGRIAAQILFERPRAHEVIELTGPETYSPRATAGLLSHIVGAPVEPELVPNAAIASALTSFGMSARNAELFRAMHEGIDSGRIAHTGHGARLVRGEVPLAQVLRQLVAR